VAALCAVLAAAIGWVIAGGGATHRGSPTSPCGGVEVALRQLFVEHPVALDIDPATAATLRADLQHLDRVCSPATSQVFQKTELEPWLNNVARDK